MATTLSQDGQETCEVLEFKVVPKGTYEIETPQGPIKCRKGPYALTIVCPAEPPRGECEVTDSNGAVARIRIDEVEEQFGAWYGFGEYLSGSEAHTTGST